MFKDFAKHLSINKDLEKGMLISWLGRNFFASGSSGIISLFFYFMPTKKFLYIFREIQ